MPDCGGLRIGVRKQRAVDAAVGDGENAAAEVLDLDFPFARFHRVIDEVALDFGEGFLIRIANHRHDQAALRADRDADVVVVVLDEIVAIHAAVDRRHGLERADRGFDEERHEAELDPVLLGEGVLHLAAQLHHRAHVASLKVVRMAAVCCAMTSCAAILRRSGESFLRVLRPSVAGGSILREPSASGDDSRLRRRRKCSARRAAASTTVGWRLLSG